MQELAGLLEGCRRLLAEDYGAIPAQRVRHDHRWPARGLARGLLQEVVRELLVVDDDESRAQHADGADAAVEVLVLEPVLIFGHAIVWWKVFDVA